jgi:hypothetical protein
MLWPAVLTARCRPSLYAQLVTLSGRVRNQRDAVPRWAIQRLEEGQADALGQLLAYGNPSEDELLVDGGEECVAHLDTEVARLNEQRQQCGAAQHRVGVSVAAVQQALDDVTRAKQQLSVVNTLPVTTIDSAIATTDKENASAEPQSGWRRILQLQMMPPSKWACV